jgi:hypothetical protein
MLEVRPMCRNGIVYRDVGGGVVLVAQTGPVSAVGVQVSVVESKLWPARHMGDYLSKAAARCWRQDDDAADQI